MAFKPLTSRIADLPLVICGPVLRKVEAGEVSVWVALKEERNVGLKVLVLEDNDALTEKFSGSAKTIPIGENLFIAVVTAKGTEKLAPGQVYHYNLFFEKGSPPGASSDSLLTSGVIDFKIHYEYEDSLGPDDIEGQISAPPRLPSFSLPPEDLNKLRIVHGSCRKPNAESLDAMPAVDKMIASEWTRADARPHYLFLTGDQIYADDVSPIVLFMLMDAGEALLGNNKREVFPPVDIPEKKEVKNCDNVTTAGGRSTWNGTLPLPDKRGCVIKYFAAFSERFSNHLMSFGEYCAMYLFTWSDAFWDALPEYNEVFPGAPKTKSLIFGLGSTSTPRFSSYNTEFGRLTRFKSSLPKVRRLLANVPVYMIFDDHEITDDWNMTYNWCEGVFSNKLGRRIIQNGMLAFVLFQGWGNTPERYDISDPKSPGGIILNKMAGWDPQAGYFVANEAGIAGPLGMPPSMVKKDLFKQVEDYVIFNSLPADQRIKWHYRVAGKEFEIIVLDGRTQRGYPDPNDPKVKKELKYRHPTMFHQGLFAEQIPTPAVDPVPLSLLISPTSIISIPALDFDEYPLIAGAIVRSKTKGDETVDIFDHWQNQSKGFEALLAHMAARGEAKDLKINTRTVILTGDVHFSAASKMVYQTNRLSGESDQTPCNAVFVQFASSSFKKQERKVKLLHYEGYKFRSIAGMVRMKLFIEDYPLFGLGYLIHVALFILDKVYSFLDLIDPFDYFEPKLPDPRKFFGWEGKADFKNTTHLKIKDSDISTDFNLLDNLSELNPGFNLLPVEEIMVMSPENASKVLDIDLPDPRWRYRIDYLVGEDEARSIIPIEYFNIDDLTLTTKNEALKGYLKASKNHTEYAKKWGSGKEIVGLNNVSELAFDWKAAEKTAIQQTWWHLERKDENDPEVFFPLTKYKASLDFQEDALPKLPK